MPKVNVVQTINGTDYLPVRAIPHVTGFRIKIQQLPDAMKDPHLAPDTWVIASTGHLQKLSLTDWATVASMVSMLPDPQSIDGIAQILAAIPASVMSKKSFEGMLDSIYIDRREPGWSLGERELMAANYSPFLPDELIPILTEGTPGHQGPFTSLVGGQAVASAGKSPPKPLEQPWVKRAKEIAIQVIARDQAKNLHPSQRVVSIAVEKQLAKEGVKGNSKKPVTAENIRRNALKGIVG